MERSQRRLAVPRGLALSAFALLLSGCEAITSSSLFQSFQQQAQPVNTVAISEQGLGKLAKGELLAAQALFDQALRNNPRDVHALVGKGLVFQQTGQASQARSAFEAVLALRPNDAQKLVVWTNAQPQSIREIASVNLGLLQNSNVAASLRQPNRQPARQAPVSQLAPRSVMAAPPVSDTAVAALGLSGGEANIIARFETLIKLRDQGLLTPPEYTARRDANAGALLPLTKPAPAASLDRPVPNPAQITQRLQAIRRALELRAITVRQHGAERTVIIDGLLPLNPANRANPSAPPGDLLAAADAVRRIERLRDRGLVSPPEYTAERAAIEKLISPKAPPQSAKKPTDLAKKGASASGPQPALHIASYRSAQAANRGWAQLRRAHRRFLGGMKHEVSRVNLGRGKGVFFRLVAGPVKSEREAANICRQLKRIRQYCEPAFMGG